MQSKIISKKRSVIVDHIKWKTIHGGLLVISQSKSQGWVIDIYFITIFVILNQKIYIMCYYILNHDDNLIFVMFYIKMSCIIFSPQISNQWFLGIFCHNFSKQSNNYMKSDFQYWSTPTLEFIQVPLHKRRKHQTAEQYQGSADRGELDPKSDVNRLASGKLLLNPLLYPVSVRG